MPFIYLLLVKSCQLFNPKSCQFFFVVFFYSRASVFLFFFAFVSYFNWHIFFFANGKQKENFKKIVIKNWLNFLRRNRSSDWIKYYLYLRPSFLRKKNVRYSEWQPISIDKTRKKSFYCNDLPFTEILTFFSI